MSKVYEGYVFTLAKLKNKIKKNQEQFDADPLSLFEFYIYKGKLCPLQIDKALFDVFVETDTGEDPTFEKMGNNFYQSKTPYFDGGDLYTTLNRHYAAGQLTYWIIGLCKKGEHVAVMEDGEQEDGKKK